MRNADARARDLDRAYVQSRVIETGFEHLTMTLEHVDPGLREDVSSCADAFETCVRNLRKAQHRSAPGEARKRARTAR